MVCCLDPFSPSCRQLTLLQHTLSPLPSSPFLPLVAVFPDLPHQSVEGVVHPHPSLGRGFNEGDAIVPSNIPGLLHVDTPGGQVTLVANHDHWHLLCILHSFDLLPILCDILEG